MNRFYHVLSLVEGIQNVLCTLTVLQKTIKFNDIQVSHAEIYTGQHKASFTICFIQKLCDALSEMLSDLQKFRDLQLIDAKPYLSILKPT